MNPRNLIRCVAATLAATTLLAAQSSPTPRPRAARTPAPPAEANERVQVRLAEVIAMLEEDDLTPAERERAKAKLEEIVARLRATPAPAAVPGVPAAPRAAAPTPQPRRARVAPPAPEPADEPQEPAPAPAKAPKAPKPPKAPAPPKAAELEIVEAEGEGDTRVLRLRSGDEVVLRRGQEWAEVADERKAAELRASAERLRTDAKVLLEARDRLNVRLRQGGDDEAAAKAQGARRRAAAEGGEQVRAWVVDSEGELREAELRALRAARGNVKAQVERALRDAGVQGERAERQMRAAAEQALRSAQVQTDRAREARAQAERVLRAARDGQPDTAPRARALFERAPAPAAPRAARDERAGGDDAEIRELIDEMRREMHEIRGLLQQLRQQATQASARGSARSTWTARAGVGSSTAGPSAPRAFGVGAGPAASPSGRSSSAGPSAPKRAGGGAGTTLRRASGSSPTLMR